MTPILWTHYKAKDGLFPVRIRQTVTKNGKTKVTYLATGIRLTKNQFINGRVTKHPDAQRFNSKIAALCNRSTSGKSFLDYYRDFMGQPHGYYHKRKLQGVLNIIKGRNPAPTLDFIMGLERYLVSEGKHPNYIASIMKCIRTVITLMVKSGDLEYHKNPFVHFKIKEVKTEKGRLSYDSLLLLQDCKLKGQQKLSRDMYLVSFYQGGMRFGDLCRITKDNISGERFHYTMNKSSQERNLPLHPVTAKILKSYKYSFPLDIDWDQEEKSINSKNTLMNKHLKSACRAAGIPEVTFHTSRHSIADYAVKKKLTSKQLQGILGHSKLTTTEAYLKSFYREETDAGMDQLFN